MLLLSLSVRYLAYLTGLCVCAAVAAMSLAVVWNAPFFFEGLLWLALAVILFRQLPGWLRSTNAARAALINMLTFLLQDPHGQQYTRPHGLEGIL